MGSIPTVLTMKYTLKYKDIKVDMTYAILHQMENKWCRSDVLKEIQKHKNRIDKLCINKPPSLASLRVEKTLNLE